MLDPKIYTLLKLEELGSYTHAAQALSLTQPAISHHIRMLEEEGVIDAGYTGSIKVKLYNLGEDIQYFQRGDKIAQLVILPIVTPALKLVDKFAKTERGDNGFGSTGR